MNEFKLDDEARDAIDVVIREVSRVQDALAPISASCDAIIEAMSGLKTGVFSEESLERGMRATLVVGKVDFSRIGASILRACEILERKIVE